MKFKCTPIAIESAKLISCFCFFWIFHTLYCQMGVAHTNFDELPNLIIRNEKCKSRTQFVTDFWNGSYCFRFFLLNFFLCFIITFSIIIVFFLFIPQKTSFLLFFCSHGKNDDKNRPKYGSVTNLSVNPEISNKISQARSLFGGSAFSLNKVMHDRPVTPNRASSATDLTNDQSNDQNKQTAHSNVNGNKCTGKVSPKPVIKTPIKFTDELGVITQNNEPAKKSTFGHIFKNFFK